MLGWNATGLSELCNSTCISDLGALDTSMKASCTQDTFFLNGMQMSLADLGDRLEEKRKTLCQSQDEGTISQYCLVVEAT